MKMNCKQTMRIEDFNKICRLCLKHEKLKLIYKKEPSDAGNGQPPQLNKIIFICLGLNVQSLFYSNLIFNIWHCLISIRYIPAMDFHYLFVADAPKNCSIFICFVLCA